MWTRLSDLLLTNRMQQKYITSEISYEKTAASILGLSLLSHHSLWGKPDAMLFEQPWKKRPT